MVIIKVQGGLGNQLLQYSIGYCVGVKFGVDVAYDLSFYEGETKYTKRPFLLDKFKVGDIRIATEEEIKNAKNPYGNFSKVINPINRFLNKFIFKSYYIGYNKNFFTSIKKNKNLY